MPAGSIYWIEKDMMGDTLINTRCSHLEEEMDYAYFEIRSYFIHSVHPPTYKSSILAAMACAST